VDEQGNVEGEADEDGEIRAEDLVSRLQKHATGNPCMDSTQVTAATRLLDYVARQPSNASDIPIAKPVMPSDVGDDDALAAYLAMIG
jgi:cbb3-type cytochrome oxidase cytochrome c subunit